MRIDEVDNALDKFLKGEREDAPDVTAYPEVEISSENLQGIRDAFARDRDQGVREELVEMLHQRKKTKKTGYVSLWFKVAAAITTLLLATLSVYLLTSNSNQYEAIYETYYRPFPIASTTRGEQTPSPIINLYEQEKYAEVVRYLESNSFVADDGGLAPTMLGVSYLNTSRPDKAIEVFANDQYFTEAPYEDYSQWYLSLAYLKTEQIEKAKSVLRQVIARRMIHKEEAAAILDQLAD